MHDEVEAELTALADDWDRAMIGNDPEAIGRFMADDWTIVGSDGNTIDRRRFLELVGSGALSHDEMTSGDLRVRVYGDAAIVSARGVSGGRYRGQPFRETELASNVFVRRAGVWRCVLTHLSRLTPRPGPPWPAALDALVAAPRHHTLMLENDRVRVLDARIAPGDTTPVHTHRWPSVLHVLGWADFVRRDGEGTVLVDTRASGSEAEAPTVLWSAPLPPHSLENVGDSEIRVIGIEIKDEAP